jgi:sporulation protein YlmC with PRC-barrel domain
MKKLAISMPLLLVAVLVLGSPLFAADMSNQSNANMNNPNMSQSQNGAASNAFNAKDLIGKDVKTSTGDSIGEVKDVILGADGRADFVVLSRGGILGAGTKYVPIPFKTFMSESNVQRVEADKDLVINLDKSKIDSAPSFSNEKWDKAGADWMHKSNCYFGAPSTQPC